MHAHPVRYGATTAWSHKLLAMAGRTVFDCWARWLAAGAGAEMGSLVRQRSGQPCCGLMGGTAIMCYIKEVAMGYCLAPVPSQLVAIRLHCVRGALPTTLGHQGQPSPGTSPHANQARLGLPLGEASTHQ